jgi:DNA-binding HxlR family transcriptional regulator
MKPPGRRDTSNCSIARTLEIVGDRWTILILREFWYGASRFSEFQQVLGCPKNLLSERLKMLTENGVICTEPYREPGERTRARYVITEKGKDLLPALLGLLQWGDKYRADPQGPAVIVKHELCGEAIDVTLVCSRGHHVDVNGVDLAPGPGFRMIDD